MLMRIVFLVTIVAVTSGVLVAAVTSGYCCGYLKAWDELQEAPPVIHLDDALLTEAIQLCRTLAAEFPDNTDYKNRVDDLLQLQAQHCGNRYYGNKTVKPSCPK